MEATSAWRDLRAQVEQERHSYEVAGKSKEARMVYAALAQAYGSVLRMMDALEENADA